MREFYHDFGVRRRWLYFFVSRCVSKLIVCFDSCVAYPFFSCPNKNCSSNVICVETYPISFIFCWATTHVLPWTYSRIKWLDLLLGSHHYNIAGIFLLSRVQPSLSDLGYLGSSLYCKSEKNKQNVLKWIVYCIYMATKLKNDELIAYLCDMECGCNDSIENRWNSSFIVLYVIKLDIFLCWWS